MNYKFPKYFIGLSLLLASFNLTAQTIFDVEFVFFKRLDQLHMQGQPEPIPLENDEVEFLLSESNALLPEGYRILARNEQQLEGVYNRLRSSPNMRPLLHLGWRQELQDKADTPWLSFNLNDAPDQEGLEGFNGIIRLSRNQGLVLEGQVVGYKEPTMPLTEDLSLNNDPESQESDLELPFSNQGSDQNNNSENNTTGNTSNEENLGAVENEGVTNVQSDSNDFEDDMQIPDELSGFFEMSETIKVKLGKLYYIDHPTMGLLIKVTPYQASLEEQKALN